MKSFTRGISNIIKAQPYQSGRYFDKDNIMILNELGDTFYYDKTTYNCTLRVNGVSIVLPAGEAMPDDMFASMNGQLINQETLLLNSVYQGEIQVTALAVNAEWNGGGDGSSNRVFTFAGIKPTLLLDDRYSANGDVDAVVFYCIEKNGRYFLAKRLFSENFEKEHLLFTISEELYDSPDRISFSFNTEYSGMYHIKKDDAVVTPPEPQTPIETWPPEVVSPVKLLAETFDDPLTVTIQFEGGKAEVDFGDGSDVKSYTDSVEYTYNDPNTSFTVSVTPQSRINTLATDIRTLTDWGSAGSISRFRFLHPAPTVPDFIPEWLVDLSDMFNGCQGFNQDISRWDVSNVNNMARMLRECRSLSANIDGWNVGKVSNMSGMLSMTSSMQSSLADWDVSKVEDMSYMFYDSSFGVNLKIRAWNVSKVRNMAGMFKNLYNFNTDLSAWDVSKVEDMQSMFEANHALFNANVGDGYWSLTGWNVGNVKNMARMFFECYEGVSSDISRWDVSNVEDMSYMFSYCYKMGHLTFWNVGKVTSMEGMFKDSFQFNSDISNWNVSNVRNMDNMLNGCIPFVADLSKWCVRHITSEPSGMFTRVDYLPDANKPIWGTCPTR